MPATLDKICAVITGIILIAIGYNMPEERRENSQKNSSFVETPRHDQVMPQ